MEFGSVGAAYGTKTNTQTVAQMPSHQHYAHPATIMDINQIGGWGGDWTWNGGYKMANRNWPSDYTGGGQAMNNVQPSRAALLVIKA